MDPKVLKDFRRMPGVGKRIAQDLWELGYRATAELAGADPQQMYEALCRLQGGRVDRCMLYVLRCAVHFATIEELGEELGEAPDPQSLTWWNYKD